MIMFSSHLVMALALTLSGPCELTLPVDALTDRNAHDFKQRLLGHFSKLGNDAGRGLVVRTKGDLATFRLDCQAIRLCDLQAALKGSQFGLHPSSWYAYGRVALEWETAAVLSRRQVHRLESALGGFGSVLRTSVRRAGDGTLRTTVRKVGDGTRFAEVVRDGTRPGFVYRARIRFKKRGQGPASKLEVIVRACGIAMKNPTLLWEPGPHMPWSDSDCGAKRKKKRARKRTQTRRPTRRTGPR